VRTRQRKFISVLRYETLHIVSVIAVGSPLTPRVVRASPRP
jgi:hypothetical protein